VNPGRDDAVLITVPARAEFLHIVRTVVGSVAARHDLTIDAIEDLRIAVDEACAQLLAVRGATIAVRISPVADGVETLCTTDAEVSAWPPDGTRHSLATQVLQGLADSVTWELTAGGPAVRVGKRAVGTSTA
jgi:serine/threonine-protein kinase RsbW